MVVNVTELKRGDILEIDGDPWQATELQDLVPVSYDAAVLEPSYDNVALYPLFRVQLLFSSGTVVISSLICAFEFTTAGSKDTSI